MDRVEEATAIVKDLNLFYAKEISEYDFVKRVCSYFDKIKRLELSNSDLKFLKYISNVAGVPHYYDLLSKFNTLKQFDNFDLNTMSAMIYESTLHVSENIKIHRFQKRVLDQFRVGSQNRIFLSATTSFGKTFLIYEIIKKLKYKNIALIFPTIALLSENYERLFTDENYSYFHDEFSIHTLSNIEEFSEKNIYIFTPERYLSFIDKHRDAKLDFVFVDEIYKIDNEYLIDTINKENERDTAYRVALQSILAKCNDVLLVGPYIEFPDENNVQLNQSFNIFLNCNDFTILDYNNYEMVGKSNIVVKNGDNKIDDELTLKLKGYSSSKAQIAKITSDIRNIKENTILYTRGAGTAETQAKNIIKLLDIEQGGLHVDLNNFIRHLINTFKYKDWIVIRALKNKIGIHHGLVPKYIQKEIINFFNAGYLDVLIATTTITEGVNTSAKNLIVLNSLKGNKLLKTFDAKNIAGRAGRFLHHYSGRVLILDKKFKEILDGSDSEIKHKNFDKSSVKDEVDYFITEEIYLSKKEIDARNNILKKQASRGIPDEIMTMYKVISHSDKISVFDSIHALSTFQNNQIRSLIIRINGMLSIDFDGLKLILEIIKPIVKNEKLNFLINMTSKVKRGKSKGKYYSVIIYMLSAYLDHGFLGSVTYNLENRTVKLKKGQRPFTIDEAVRESSTFIFSTLKYQLVKYLGIFNMMYKYHQSILLHKPIEEIIGIDRLLLKLEYNATSNKGRLASDYGVPSKIVEYYEKDENEAVRMKFDNFEEAKFQQIESILNK